MYYSFLQTVWDVHGASAYSTDGTNYNVNFYIKLKQHIVKINWNKKILLELKMLNAFMYHCFILFFMILFLLIHVLVIQKSSCRVSINYQEIMQPSSASIYFVE